MNLRVILFIYMIVFCQTVFSQSIWQKLKGVVSPTLDTTYVENNPQGLIMIPFGTINAGRMTFGYTDTISGEKTKFKVNSPAVVKIGPCVSFKGFSLSYGFRPKRNRYGKQDMNYSFSVNGQRLGADFFLSTSEQSKISDWDDKIEELGYTNTIKTSRAQASCYFVFHADRFSMPAAFNQSKRQKRSCGSPMLGLSFSNTLAILRASRVPVALDTILSLPCTFKHFRYTLWGVNGGYGFNGVTKHWLLHVSAQMSLPVYSKSKMILVDGQAIQEKARYSISTKIRLGALCSIGKHHQILTNVLFHTSFMIEGKHEIQDNFLQGYLSYRWIIN